MPVVRPKIELGLGGSFYGTMLNESSLVGLWPNDTLVGATFKDLNSGARDLTAGGFANSPGHSGPLPEGGLANLYQGTNYASRTDAALRPSNVTLVVIFNTPDVTTDQTMAGAGTADGYRFRIAGGSVNFYVYTGVGTLTNPGLAISTNTWYLAIGRFDGTTARLAVTNIATGVTTSTSALLSGPLFYSGTPAFRLGTNDALSAPYFGQIQGAAVCSTSISDASVTLIQATTQWTDVTVDAIGREPIHAKYGTQGNGVLDRIASTGSLTFLLNDSETNSGKQLGLYSPGNARCYPGFKVGIPVRFTMTNGATTYRKWVGTIDRITPDTWQYGPRGTHVSCVDWFEFAASVPISGIPVQINANTSTAIAYALQPMVGKTPNNIFLPSSGDTFPYVFDSTGEGTPVLAEAARIIISEFGAMYIRGDTLYGNKLVVEMRGTRETQTTNDFTFAEADISDVVVAGINSQSYNDVRVTITPRLVDSAATTVLYALSGTQRLAPGETATFEAAYRDPAQQAARVGGTSMVAPVATTDYLFNESDSGSGADLTASLGVSAVFGGSSAIVTVTNNHATKSGAITFFQLRGKGIYIFNPMVLERTTATKIATRGPRVLSFEMPYQNNISTAQSIGAIILKAFDGAPLFAQSFSAELTRLSSALADNVLSVEPGHRVGLTETVSGLSNSPYYVQSVEIDVQEGGAVSLFTFGLAPALASGTYWLLDDTTYSILDSTTIPGY